MKIKLLLLGILFSFSFLLAHAGNPTNTKKNDVAGGVFHADTKKPLCRVNVTAYAAEKREKTVMTDGNGNYSFNDLKPGIYKLVFEKEGYKKIIKDKVIIRSEEGAQLNIEMFENEEFPIMPGQLIFTDYK